MPKALIARTTQGTQNYHETTKVSRFNVTPPNNFNKFGGVTTLQDNNKTQAIEI
jgi:hypothetical protein